MITIQEAKTKSELTEFVKLNETEEPVVSKLIATAFGS